MNAARALLSVTVRQARPVASRQCQQQFRLLSAVAPTGGKETKSMTVETSAATESELDHERGLQGTITVQGPADISLVSVGQQRPQEMAFLYQRLVFSSPSKDRKSIM